MIGGSSAPAPSSGDLDAMLARYRDLVGPIVLAAIPDREPKRHLYDLVAGQLARSGKGIRPALCIATCRAFGGDEARALPSAAALELLHNAFLVHDDIEDGSEYRRDLPAMHRQCGVPIAVNVGDAMNAMSVRVLKQNMRAVGPELAWRVLEEFDHMTAETLEGQAMELGWIRDNDCDTSEDDYLRMVLKKTCWYSFIHPARIGALVAQPERTDLGAFDAFGCYLGTAFQIQDDVLNLTGLKSQYGKEIGGDILEGKRTLVLAHLLRRCDAQEKARLKSFLSKPRSSRLPREVAWVYGLLGSYGSIEYGRKAARDFVEAARGAFDAAYAGAVPGPDLDFVRKLVEYVVQRGS